MKKSMSKGNKVLFIILGIILALVLFVAVVIIVNAPTNVKAMNSAIDTAIETIKIEYTVTEVDCGDYSTMSVYGIMKFDVKQYDVEGVGNLSVMTMNMGVMQMATVVLTPVYRDIPLISMDYMYILGNRKCYLEFYDLILDKEGDYKELISDLEAVKTKYDNLDDVTPTAAWYDALKTVGIYKSGTKANDIEFNNILVDGIGTVLSYSKTLPELTGDDRAEKINLQKSYSDGLIENGGVSTDAFVTSLGAETTKDFFDKVLFKAE